MEFKTIILTTDLSDNADAATPYAVELARKFGASLHLVHVFVEPHVYSGLAEGIVIGVSTLISESHRVVTQKLNDLAHMLGEKERMKVDSVTLRGDPVTKIVEYANKHKADCIVIATHGRTGLSHVVHGSVAERVVRMSKCPVLSVRPEEIKPGKA